MTVVQVSLQTAHRHSQRLIRNIHEDLVSRSQYLEKNIVELVSPSEYYAEIKLVGLFGITHCNLA